MRDIQLSNYSKNQITEGFEEIFQAAKDCKFNNCNHIDNDGCNITKCLLHGEISKSRYNNFIKLIEK